VRICRYGDQAVIRGKARNLALRMRCHSELAVSGWLLQALQGFPFRDLNLFELLGRTHGEGAA